MARYIIEIEDNATGVSFKAGVAEAKGGATEEDTPAKQMVDYLIEGVQLYLDTKGMDAPQLAMYLRVLNDKKTLTRRLQ